MKTNLTPSTNSAAFRGANLIKIRKTAFPNPGNYKECSELFTREMNKISGDSDGIVGLIKAMLSTKTHKNYILPANTAYSVTENALKQNNIPYSVQWFSQRAKLPIRTPEASDYHSFYVLTGEEKDKGIKLVKKILGSTKAFAKEAREVFSINPEIVVGRSFTEILKEYLPLQKTYAVSRSAIEMEKTVNEIIGKRAVNTLEINTLEDLPKIVKNIS